MRTQRSSFIRGTVGLVTVLLAAVVCVGVTSAGVPGRWEIVAKGGNVPGSMASELGLARTPDGLLHVAWKEQTGPLTASIRVRTFHASGSPRTDVRKIVEGWVGLSDPELVVDRGGGLRVYFGGLRTTQSGDPMAGLLTATDPPFGASWSTPEVIHNRNFVGARNSSVTVARDGSRTGLVRRRRELPPPRS